MGSRRWVTIAACSLALVAGLVLAWFHGRPHPTPAATSTRFRTYLADPSARIVAYAPPPQADSAAITAALSVLRAKFGGLSLYGCDTQTVAIVEAATRLHYRAVLLTIWDPRAESELAIAASIVRDSQASIALAVSIGSEGLMEHRYTLEDVQSARAELLDRAATEKPAGGTVEMTTTEPWWLYRNPESGPLRAFGDFTSVNVHVVWDTDIVSPDLAAAWTRDRAEEDAGAVSHPLLLRESGFPGGGHSPRESSKVEFNRKLQADFWSSWLHLQQRPPSVFFEAVDNEEKHWRGFEGDWGLLKTDLRPWPAWDALPTLEPTGSLPAR